MRGSLILPKNREGLLAGFPCRAKALEKRKRNGKLMKKVLLSMALVVAAPFAWGQVSETTTTTTTTEGSGRITEFSPGSTIVLKETAGPKHYRFGKRVTYVTRSGKELDEATVRTRIKVGVPSACITLAKATACWLTE
jgi:hypothetical protein